MEKPFSQSCENNKAPILEVLKPLLKNSKQVLEIGSGTGQHAVHFAAAMPWLEWQCSDQQSYLAGINMWLAEAKLKNTPEPLELNVTQDNWPIEMFDTVFSANTAHIMHWPEVVQFFAGVGERLKPGGQFFLYGPMNYGGKFSSDSNMRFNEWLKADDPNKGIRDFEALDELAIKAKLKLQQDFSMPANNQILQWRKE